VLCALLTPQRLNQQLKIVQLLLLLLMVLLALLALLALLLLLLAVDKDLAQSLRLHHLQHVR
jgi:hypothetical protein